MEQIPAADVKWLDDQMMLANYFSLSVPDCSAMATDHPTVTTSLVLAGQSHTIVHYTGNSCAPSALKTLEDRIDEVTNSAQWVKCDTTGGLCSS